MSDAKRHSKRQQDSFLTTYHGHHKNLELESSKLNVKWIVQRSVPLKVPFIPIAGFHLTL